MAIGEVGEFSSLALGNNPADPSDRARLFYGGVKQLTTDGALRLDQDNANNGTLTPSLSFGSGNVGIASKRTAGGNQNGLDLYTNSTPRLSITNTGNIGIGTAGLPTAKLEINGDLKLQQGVAINEFSNDGTLGGDSDQAVPTEKAVKAYVNTALDTKAAVNGAATQDFQTRNLTVTGNLEVTGTTTITGNAGLEVKGAIRAGGSDLYFTETTHNHTGIGNTAGFAAIENATNFGALMILGRAGTAKGRYVRLWDYLQINGSMDITSNLGIGTDATSLAGRLEIKSSWGNWIFLRQDRDVNGGGGFHIHNPWGNSNQPQGDDSRNRLEIGYQPSTGNTLWGHFVIHGPTGNVGIGTAIPRLKLDVQGNTGWIGSSDSSQALGGWRLGRWPDYSANTWVYLSRTDSTKYQDLAVGALWAGGAQRFGTADDVAEMTPVRAEDHLEPGDVVVIDHPPDNRVLLAKSSLPYDARVAGVISNPATAGLVIGGSHPTDVDREDIKPLALTGRVVTKVTLENGPINVGDPLTTSATPGCAMKATKSGYILGRALQSFGGERSGVTCGRIWVLVHTGWFGGIDHD